MAPVSKQCKARQLFHYVVDSSIAFCRMQREWDVLRGGVWAEGRGRFSSPSALPW